MPATIYKKKNKYVCGSGFAYIVGTCFQMDNKNRNPLHCVEKPNVP